MQNQTVPRSFLFSTLQPTKLCFYADSPRYTNKLFSFHVSSFEDAWKLYSQFLANGNWFRSLFIKCSFLFDKSAEPTQLRFEQIKLVQNNLRLFCSYSDFLCSIH